MAKVGEFYITPDGNAWEKNKYAVREKIGLGLGDWRRVAVTQSHFMAKRIMKALTEQAKRDPLCGVDVEKEKEEIYKKQQERMIAHAWENAGRFMLEELEEQEQKKRDDIKQHQFVAGKLTIQTPRGATIITKQNGMFICQHKGGDAELAITIE